jgi:hypothetical protein
MLERKEKFGAEINCQSVDRLFLRDSGRIATFRNASSRYLARDDETEKADCNQVRQSIPDSDPWNGEALRTATTETSPKNGQAIILTNAAVLAMLQVKHNQRALVRTDEAKWIRLNLKRTRPILFLTITPQCPTVTCTLINFWGISSFSFRALLHHGIMIDAQDCLHWPVLLRIDTSLSTCELRPSESHW